MRGAFPDDRLEALDAASGALAFLADKLPVEDLTAAASAGRRPRAVMPLQPAINDAPPSSYDSYDSTTRAIRCFQRHVLQTGLKAGGTTSIVRELVMSGAAKETPFCGRRSDLVDRLWGRGDR